MKRGRRREVMLFSVSFLDVLANSIGGLAFLLVMAAVITGMVVAFVAPRINTAHLPDGYQGRPYTNWLSARDGLGRYQWKFTSGDVPPGLNLEADTGLLSGVPRMTVAESQAKQRFDFTVECQAASIDDPAATKASQATYSLTVHRQPPVQSVPLRISTKSPLPHAYLDQPYPLTFAAEGGQPPYTWSVDGNGPPGLTLSRNGSFEGQPTAAGSNTFQVRVVSTAGEVAVATVSMVVSKPQPPPPPIPPLQIRTTHLAPAVAEQDYVIQPAAEGGVPPYRWSVVGERPSWLRADPSGTFAGRPDRSDVGETLVTWQLTDSRSVSTNSAPVSLSVLPPVVPEPKQSRVPAWVAWVLVLFALTLLLVIALLWRALQEAKRPPTRALTVLSSSLPNGRASMPYEVQLACDGGTGPYRWQVVEGELPPGMSLSPEGKLSGEPFKGIGVDQTKEIRFRVEVTDSRGAKATQWL